MGKVTLLAILLAVGGGLVAPALAADVPAGSSPPGQRTAIAKEKLDTERLARYDVDGDGRLDSTERQAERRDVAARMKQLKAKRQAHEAAMLRKYDATGDGTLSREEKEVMRQGRMAEIQRIRARLFSEYDVDGNGVLDPAEKGAIRKNREGRPSRGMALRNHDTNGDGVLDAEEKASMRSSHEAWLRDFRARALQLFDANRNGKLDPEERQAIRGRARRAAPPATTGPGTGSKPPERD